MKNATELLDLLLKQVDVGKCHGVVLLVVRDDHMVEMACGGIQCHRLNAIHDAVDKAVRVVQQCPVPVVVEEEVDLGGGDDDDEGGGGQTVH
jgi:hypothetical protein